jgi:hypothetical protein
MFNGKTGDNLASRQKIYKFYARAGTREKRNKVKGSMVKEGLSLSSR